VDNDFTNYTFAPSLFPPSTKPTPPPQTGGTGRPSARDRDCACTYRNIWLDIAFLIESSAAMTRQGLGEISGTLAGIVNEMTISQTVNQSSRIGITVYAEQPTVLSTLSSFTDADQVQSQLLSLSNTYYSDTTRPNLLSGMQTSINQFSLGGTRSWARNVLLIVATSYAAGGQLDALQLSRQFRENGGFVIVVAYQQPSEADIPDICNLASEGMCYKTGNTSKDLFHEVATALCYANCFCKTNDHQFIVNQAFYGTCLHPVAAPTTANTAERICDTEDGLLPQIYTQEKLNFITTISINQLETDQTWVGLKYNTTLNGWFWSSLEGDVIKIDDTELWDNWQPGQPNRTAGDCVQLKRYQGFQLRFQSAPCSSAATAQLKYTCQYNACDTDKFCPDASFPGSG